MTQALRRVKIAGTGMYVPPKVVTNADLEKLMDTSDEWIQQRSGIKERRYAEDGVGASDLAFAASTKALAAAGFEAKDLDLVIVASLSPDYYFPGASVFLQDRLGLGTTAAMDLRCQCSGFLYALNVGQLFVASGQYNRVLVCGAETHSRGLNFTTAGRDVSVLFGDGAGAVVLAPAERPDQGVLAVKLHAEGSGRDLLKIEYPSFRRLPAITHDNIEAGKQWPVMDGKQVFRHAVRRMPEVVNEVLQSERLSPGDVDHYFFHQANLRINEAAMQQLGQPMEKSFNNIQRYGNCSAASIPMVLDEAVRLGRVKTGDLICMASFGAGFTWAGALVRW
jgi:3-oxoacyl-[acyl-carrier-protein] synthase-3